VTAKRVGATGRSEAASASAEAAVAKVVLVPASGRLGVLDYRIPPGLRGLRPGSRVLVPLGPRRCMGMVTALADRADLEDRRLRDVIDTLDPTPIFGAALLELVGWMADYYVAAPGDTLATALPGVLRIETEKVAELVETDEGEAGRDPVGDAALVKRLRDGPLPVAALRAELGDAVDTAVRRLQRRKRVRVIERFVREVAPTRYEVSYSAARCDDPSLLARRPALRTLYEYLAAHPRGRVAVRELQGSFANAAAKVRQLRDLGLIRQHRREIYREVSAAAPHGDRPVSLNAAQRAAVDRITAALDDGFQPFLLLGVTGSGKTEVYLRIVGEVLDRGRNALILVPEISLTHQLVSRVRARFRQEIAVLHSGLGPGERWDEWRRLARGEARIAIGARSAVFAPLPRLGVIVVDEEHDGAYKQADGVRYHGRDVAVMRAKLEECAVVLGSATASMESLHNAGGGRYTRLVLPDRVASRPMPAVELVDLRGREMKSPLSPPLAAAVEANLAAGNQTLLFLNRRGFANALQCRACGEPVACPNCSISLTWHQRDAALRCHYCDFTIGRPPTCGGCGEAALDTWGWGTERLETFLREHLPGARIARMDRDTTSRKGSLAALLERWNSGALDILIGTQMVTKGHDVAGVTLVGVILADLGLNLPDFRAAEKTFQQLAQVAGRAGRGDKPGRVLVQTLQPEHYVLRAVVDHDFTGFAEHEVRQREELGYPPFGRLLLVRFEGTDAPRTQTAAERCAERMRAAAPRGVAVLGPAPAPLARLRGRHRWQILLRGKSGAALRRLATTATQSRGRGGDELRVLVDVDPQNLS
jgi:primosomal protein N' (replication factor Y) (superfamily II helicase)